MTGGFGTEAPQRVPSRREDIARPVAVQIMVKLNAADAAFAGTAPDLPLS